eukprot:3422154-Prymnesium_polylepis.1
MVLAASMRQRGDSGAGRDVAGAHQDDVAVHEQVGVKREPDTVAQDGQRACGRSAQRAAEERVL